MRTLETPTCYRMTPAWRAMLWRHNAVGVWSPMDTWHPMDSDGEWYDVTTPHPIFGDHEMSGSGRASWRRGIWTGGRHEADARTRFYRVMWGD